MDLLPPEIISHIMKYLSLEDRKQMALVNKNWYYASLHTTLIKKDWVTYDARTKTHKNRYSYNDYLDLQHFISFKEKCLNSKRTHFNLKIYFTTFIDPIEIYKDLGIKLVSLILINLPWFIDSVLESITKYCINIERLEIEGVRNIYINDGDKIHRPLLNLTSIKFNNVYITDRNFNIIMKCFPNLKSLELKNCKIKYWPELIKNFYPDYDDSDYDYDTIFTEQNVINYLKTTKNINNLILQNYNIFINLPSHIKLKYLTLDCLQPLNIDFSDEHLIIFKELSLKLSMHVSLLQLDIKMFPCCLLSSLSKLHNLEQLKVQFIFNSSNRCNVIESCFLKFVESLINMKKLRKLSLIPVNQDGELMCPIPDIPKDILDVLTLLDCVIENGRQITYFNKNLKYLRIRNGNVLTTNDVHFIFNNFLNLKSLWIDGCCVLDDELVSVLSISNLKELTSLTIDGNLSYRCLQYINLLHLEHLVINNMSIRIESYDLFDFEESLIQFGCIVPALTSLSLRVLEVDKLHIKNEGLILSQPGPLFNKLKYSFKKLKYFNINI